MAVTSEVGAPTRYHVTQIVMHWAMAALVLFVLVSGIVMSDLEWGPLKNQLYNLHRPIGLLILVLLAVRVVLRLVHGAPPADPSVSPLIHRAAGAAHAAFYALLLALPLVGWAATSAFRAPIPIFGLFEAPPIWPKDRALSETLFEVHEIMSDVLIVLIIAHAGAALVHHFIWKDDTLRRMGA